ncbi:GNAT family N-acetyltransferase [Peribacillus alkalitolerans]|uniref:GNAT family N-acetyltransferase n=1 Tax=Peribacillus alkalitolerans TaxID=1550385 RepID=UPI0013D61C2F|nr:GNAT family N-acetyltransferase [Peribacillus alkalitolerans]
MFVAKNDTKVIIRTGHLDDADTVLDIQRDVISESDYFIAVSDEYNKTLEQQREWLQKLLENDRETILVAEINGVVVGLIVFSSQNRKRLSHTGSFGMMISKDYRNIGIGKMLLKSLLEWATNNPLIEKVSLGVFSTNHRAISLYKSMGFIEEGRKIKEFKINDNEYVDDILMYKWV